jgi:hypothetical protein
LRIQNKILQRSFTAEFYSQNAMFFLLIIGFAFGFMRDKEHKALADFITALPICTLIPIAIWAFYAYKIVSFNSRTSHLREMAFIFDLVLLPRGRRIVPLLMVSINQFTPAIGYGIFLILMAIKNQAWLPLVILSGSLVTFVFIITSFLYRSIRFPQHEMKVSKLKTWLDGRSEKNHVRIFTEWIIRTHPGMIFFTKVVSCALIFAVSELYKYDTYDYRLLAMASLLAFSSMLAFVYQYVMFENSRFDVLRNLPISLWNRTFLFLSSLAILSLPELIVMVRFYPEQLSIIHLADIVVFGFSLLLGGYCILLKKNIEFERMTSMAFGGGMGLFLLILFKVPLLALSAAALMYVMLNYRRNFYGFEIVIK